MAYEVSSLVAASPAANTQPMPLADLLRAELNRLLDKSGRGLTALAKAMGVPISQLHGFLLPAPGKEPKGISLKRIDLEKIVEFFEIDGRAFGEAIGLHSTAQLLGKAELESGETRATMGPTQEDDPLHSRRQSIIALVGSLVREEDLQLFEAAAQELMARRSGREQSGAGKRSNEGR